MTFLDNLRHAGLNFKTAKLRSFLALLGIIIGTAATVALVSTSQLATEAAMKQFKAMSTDLVSLSLFQEESQPSAQKTILSLNQWQKLPRLIAGIRDIAPYSTTYHTIYFEGRPVTGPIIGANPALAKLIHINIAEGHFVSYFDSFEHFCFIGEQFAEELRHIWYGELVGHQLIIGRTSYTIIGVAAHWQENSFFNSDINQAVIVPIKGMRLISPNTPISNAILTINPKVPVDMILDSIKSTLHTLSPNQRVFIRSAKQIILGMEQQHRIFTLLLTCIGVISLLVGGVGIMNIMLVSVSERKHEIGIRKALGATHSHIHLQFLIEAGLLSLIGGTLGVLCGGLITYLLTLINHWPYHLHFFSSFIGFMVSLSVGILSGIYPAHTAARLDPVISLRNV